MSGLGDTFTGCNFDTKSLKDRSGVVYTHSHRQRWTLSEIFLAGSQAGKHGGAMGRGVPAIGIR